MAVPELKHPEKCTGRQCGSCPLNPCSKTWAQLDLNGIHWVIVGGESGAGARPIRREWVEEIRKQCSAHKIPFFFKQWGGVHKKRQGRELNGRTYNELPKRERQPIVSKARRLELARDLALELLRGEQPDIARPTRSVEMESGNELPPPGSGQGELFETSLENLKTFALHELNIPFGPKTRQS